MNTPTIVVLVLAIAGVLTLPRRWAPIPFLLLACYIPRSQLLDLGLLTFHALRILTVVTLFRILVRGDWKGLALHASDYLMVAWTMLMVSTAAFHRDPSAQVIERLGLALDGMGLYLVFRFLCRTPDDIRLLAGALSLLLVPLAASMVYEKVTSHNLLAFFGSPEGAQSRDGSARARGPFRHAILAGTIGALSVPFIAALWPTRRAVAAAGPIACLCIVVASNSSGPIMSLASALLALGLWRFRHRLRLVQWAFVGLYCALAVVMNRPVYYLMGSIDLTGGSTGWHRARLIESSIDHLDEWWLAGTDYTRHWMATGVSWSPDHTDITNHYIALGVYGGLPLLLCFLALLAVSFRHVGRYFKAPGTDSAVAFLPWAAGSALFTIAVTSVSISYFDQSILWLYMTIAVCRSGQRPHRHRWAHTGLLPRRRDATRRRPWSASAGTARGGPAPGQPVMSVTDDKPTDPLRAAIFGASLDVGNRGVNALGESVASLALQAQPSAEVTFHYYSPASGTRRLGAGKGPEVTVRGCRLSPRGRPPDQISVIFAAALLYRLGLAWPARRNPWLSSLLRASFIGEIRGGDSLSDIYGLRGFLQGSLPLLSVLLLGRPYALLPQTYGPFRTRTARWLAKRLLRSASDIWTRDRRCIPTVEALAGRTPRFSPDVAFTLQPAQPAEMAFDPSGVDFANAPVLVGLNVSGLLYMGGYTRDNMFGLRSTYRDTVERVMQTLLTRTNATVLIVPHTFGEMEDEASAALLASAVAQFPGRAVRLTTQLRAAELKWLIGRTHFFVGSRMHACIAALSQCVPTVGLGYSDKFLGVFESAGVGDAVVDLRQSDADEVSRAVLGQFEARSATAARLATHMPAVQAQVRQAFATMFTGA